MSSLIVAAVLGIALIVVLIAVVKVHPFLSLMIGSAATAIMAGVPYYKSLDSFTDGVGSTVSGVGLLVALGGIIGILLTRSGGADVIVDTILEKAPRNKLSWAMALSAFIGGYSAVLRSWCSNTHSDNSSGGPSGEDARRRPGHPGSCGPVRIACIHPSASRALGRHRCAESQSRPDSWTGVARSNSSGRCFRSADGSLDGEARADYGP